jgi:hypothetical protein
VRLNGLADDGFNRFAEPFRARCSTHRQKSLDTTAGLGEPEQLEDAAAFDAEFPRRPIDVIAGTRRQAGQACQHHSPLRGLGPLDIRVLELINAPGRWLDPRVRRKSERGRTRGHDLAGIVAQQHGVGAKRALDAPARPAMLDHDTRRYLMFHNKSPDETAL